jgi:uncharacterized membrane protein YraQ (UPF0718 family)
MLLLNVIEMIVLHKTSLLWALMIFIASYFHSYPNKKKLKSTLIEKIVRTILVIKIPTLSSL